MTRNILNLIIILTGLTSCDGIKKETPNTDKLSIQSSDIQGKWYLNKWTRYCTLDFSNNTVFADNNIDTVFTFGYEIKKDTLITYTLNQKFINKIILLSKDSLVLDGFGDILERRSYSRVSKYFE